MYILAFWRSTDQGVGVRICIGAPNLNAEPSSSNPVLIVLPGLALSVESH